MHALKLIKWHPKDLCTELFINLTIFLSYHPPKYKQILISINDIQEGGKKANKNEVPISIKYRGQKKC